MYYMLSIKPLNTTYRALDCRPGLGGLNKVDVLNRPTCNFKNLKTHEICNILISENKLTSFYILHIVVEVIHMNENIAW